MKPEEKARSNIDDLLKKAGWIVQDYKDANLGAGLGVAVREFELKSGTADYLMFIDRKIAGVIEAKPEGTTLSGVSEQSEGYIKNIPEVFPTWRNPPPFHYESTGVETFFRDLRDPDSRSRRVFAFHKPEMLLEYIKQPDTLRLRLGKMPSLITSRLWDCQIQAIQNLEKSLADNRPRSLIQMSTGSGKTFTAVNFIYRLVKHVNVKRILFLVDRSNLGKQTLREFQNFETPDDKRKFTEIYNVQRLTTNKIDPVCRVTITTIQRLYSMLRGEPEFAEELEEISGYELYGVQKPKEVSYNADIPIETFDFIITDECHRSIYNLWRQVLEYFDAFIIGLTATPSKQTIGFFNQNLVMEYPHERAVADGVNVGYEIYRIRTKISERGSTVEAGYTVDKRDKESRKVTWEKLDNNLEYHAKELDRSVVSKDQIRTVIKTYKEKLFTELFPGRKEVPKTLIFAKDDSHAEDIVHIVREEFGKGNDFCKKITYRTTGEKPEDLIASFRNSFNPRIAVTVDMISTGTDIKALECLLFMRDVKSSVYFEQMKGRGSRTISGNDLKTVTPDANNKTHFVIVDAVGVTESIKQDTKPLEKNKSIPLDKLLHSVAMGNRDEDIISTLAGRLARLDRALTEKQKEDLKSVSGKSLNTIVNGLLDAIDYDKQIEKAKYDFKTDEPTGEQIKKVAEQLTLIACRSFDNPKYRELLVDIKRQTEQYIDTISKDEVLESGYDIKSKSTAGEIVKTLKQFIEDNKDELTAIQIIYSEPYSKRHLTYEMIRQLADAMQKPPYNLTPERVWRAYEQLEKFKVRGAGPQKLLTDVISILRYSLNKSEFLEPFKLTVERRFQEWLTKQRMTGRVFTEEQVVWLNMIKDHIASSGSISVDNFETVPFNQKGGAFKAHKLFGGKLNDVIKELNESLV